MARERRKVGPVEMVGRHEKWTGHNENKVGENRGRAYFRGLNNQSGWYFEPAVNMSVRC